MRALGRGTLLRAAGLSFCCLLAGCVNMTTQRWPGPMRAEVDPLPPGDSNLHPPGAEEVTIIRHADPVGVRTTGSTPGRPLAFYDKQTRLNAGGQVIVAPGGRAEVLWPEGSSVVLFGRSVAWIGSPSRDEPMLDLREVERGRVMLREGDVVRLVGGALLSGAGGPYLLHYSADNTLAVHNQSKGSMTVAFRDEVFEMGPGQRVLLPLLSDGGAPFEPPQEVTRLAGPGFNLDVQGDIVPTPSGGGLALLASGPGEVAGLGVRVRMEPGGKVTFRDLAAEAEEAPTAPAYDAPEVPAEPPSDAPPDPEGEDGEPPQDSEGG